MVEELFTLESLGCECTIEINDHTEDGYALIKIDFDILDEDKDSVYEVSNEEAGIFVSIRSRNGQPLTSDHYNAGNKCDIFVLKNEGVDQFVITEEYTDYDTACFTGEAADDDPEKESVKISEYKRDEELKFSIPLSYFFQRED